MFKTLCEALLYSSQLNNIGITFIDTVKEEHKLPYSKLYDNARKYLAILQMRGIKQNDELVLQIEDTELFLTIFWSCILGGIIPVPITIGNTDEHKMKVFNIWEILNNPYIFTTNKILSEFEKTAIQNHEEELLEDILQKSICFELLAENNSYGTIAKISEGDIAFIQFSSGSTGRPKGITLTHNNLVTNIKGIIKGAQFNEKDIYFSWMPLTHDMGMIGFHLTPLFLQREQIIMPTLLFIWHPTHWMEITHKYKATVLSSPNFGLRYFLDYLKRDTSKGWNLKRVRFIFNGAEPITPELCEEFLHVMSVYGLREESMFTVYGMAEASLAVTFPKAGEKFKTVYVDRLSLKCGEKIIEVLPESNHAVGFVVVGYPIEECNVRVCDNLEHPVEDKIVGCIQINGNNVTQKYYNNPDETKKVYTEDGWLRTGDNGFTINGQLVITGREKEIIFINGQNYYPHDIENNIEKIINVKAIKVAACGVKIKDKEEIAVFVLYKKKINGFADIALNIRKQIGLTMGLSVQFIIPIKKMPKTTSGKIERYKLAMNYIQGEYDLLHTQVEESIKSLLLKKIGNGENSISSVQQELINECKKIINSDNISINDNFFEWGITSIQLNLIIKLLSEKYLVNVQVSDLFSYPTIETLSKFICEDEKVSEENKIKIEDIKEKEIAIIGIGLNFPKAQTIEEYWNLLCEGKDCITKFPEYRKRDVEDYLRFLGKEEGEVQFRTGGYLEEVDKFDYQFFHIPYKEAELMNPNQRLLLETVWNTIENAGYSGKRIIQSSTGVYLGYIGDNEGFKYKQMIDNTALSLKSVSVVGNLSSIIPSRISYLLDLKGPTMLIDTACSSSLTAVHTACKGIINGDCNMALAGGLRISLFPFEDDEKIGIESIDGKAKVFDQNSDGTGFGEGIGIVMLKLLSEAVKDGDNIYAVIKGSALNQDGKSIGITAPNTMAQTNVIESAWKESKISPETISYIEAHGTGTQIGDVIEIDAINKAFSKYTNKKQFCGVGSVKSNIGHLFEASGIAGLIKTALALKYKKIPPTIHFTTPNDKIDFVNSAVYINSRLRDWEPIQGIRRCGISAFGFSGTNCHVILEEAPAKPYKSDNIDMNQLIPQRFLLISAKKETSLKELAKRYIQILEKNEEIDNICYTANTGRKHFKYRVAILADSRFEFINKLKKVLMLPKFNGKDKNILYGISNMSPEESQQLNSEAEKLVQDYKQNRDNTYLYKLCDLYKKGADIYWSKIYDESVMKKIEIPSYPFDKSRCWINIPGKQNQVTLEENFYYQLTYKYKELQFNIKKHKNNKIVLLKGKNKRWKSISELLIKNGNTIIEIEFGDKFKVINKTEIILQNKMEDYKKLLIELKNPSEYSFLFLQSLDEKVISKTEELISNQERELLSLFRFTKALIDNGVQESIQVMVVADNVNAVTGTETELKPEHASFFQLGKVIIKECANINVRCVDIDSMATDKDIVNSFLYQEEYMGIYRNGRRFVEELKEVDLYEAANEPVPITENGTYIITGGLGGIGLEVAKYLASQRNINLIMLNRSNFPESGTWDEVLLENENEKVCHQIIELRNIERMGSKVFCFVSDVTDFDTLKDRFDKIRNQFGSIHGIIHGAGIAGEGYIVGKKEDTFKNVISPKIYGTWNIHLLTKNDKLDFMILFSSVASILTVQGQSDYTVGNAFLDSFAKYRNKLGERTISFNWVSWKETGMAVDYGMNTDLVFKSIRTNKAINAFEQVLNKKITNILIGQLNVQSSMILMLENFPFELSPRLKDFVENVKQKLEMEKSLSDTQRKIMKICKNYIVKENIDIHMNFLDMGADSILLTKFSEELKEEFGKDITVAKVFSYPSVEKLASFIDSERIVYLGKNKKISDKTEIAVIGIAAKMPDADSKEKFWDNIINGYSSVKDIPESRKETAERYLYYAEGRQKEDLKFLKGGYLQSVDEFACDFFEISEQDASLMDPNQRIFLQTVYEAIEDAGYGGNRIKGTNTGIFMGLGDNFKYTYGNMIMETNPNFVSISIPGNIKSNIVGRISYMYDLKGPSIVVDTACSASLIAVHQACQSLNQNDCTMAIAGAIKLNLLPVDDNHKIGFESADGYTRSFDDNASGAGIGEGAGVVILKKLEDALLDGDNIYAVIKGSAVNQDGKSAGLTTPNASAQTELLVDAWNNAGIQPEEVTYIEAHGTGTKIGDPIEIEGINSAFRMFTKEKQFCAISSVKSNIGHLYEASGIAGLIKAVYSLKYSILPASINFNKLNSNINFEDSSIYINAELKQWKMDKNKKKICGVSAFGISGTNCHLVLEEFNHKISVLSREKGPFIFTLSAKNESEFTMLCEKYINFLEEGIPVYNLCLTSNVGRGHYKFRFAAIIHTVKELMNLLEAVAYGGKVSSGYSYYGIHKKVKVMSPVPIINEVTSEEIRFLSNHADTKIYEYCKGKKLKTGILQVICELYVRGANPDWIKLYDKENINYIQLPSYSFQNKKLWFKIPEKREQNGNFSQEIEKLLHNGNIPENYKNELKEKWKETNRILQECNKYVEAYEDSEKKRAILTGRSSENYTEIEIQIAEIWSDLIGIEKIDLGTNYFEVGGDSIKAIQIISRLQSIFPLITINDLWKYQTIKELADYIDKTYFAEKAILPLDLQEKEWLIRLSYNWNKKELEIEWEYWSNILYTHTEQIVVNEFIELEEDALGKVEETTMDLSFIEANKAFNTRTEEILVSALALSLSEVLHTKQELIKYFDDYSRYIEKEKDTSQNYIYMYPLLLDIGESNDYSFIIKSIKEEIRHIPENGLRYDWIKHNIMEVEEKQITDAEKQSLISFTYRETKESEISLGRFLDKSCGISLIIQKDDNKMVVRIDYKNKQYESTLIWNLLNCFIRQLTALIQECVKKEEIEFTPSDFGNEELTLEELGNILDVLE